MGARNHALLPHLAQAARDARMAAEANYSHIAVYVVKRKGTVGVSDSTVSRFEQGLRWPEDPDAMVRAYAKALGVRECDIWERAVGLLCNRRLGSSQ